MAKSVKKTEPQTDYITMAEYIRKKHALMLLSNPNARALDHRSLNRAIERGDIIPYKQGDLTFIDWNAYKNIVFRQKGIRK